MSIRMKNIFNPKLGNYNHKYHPNFLHAPTSKWTRKKTPPVRFPSSCSIVVGLESVE